jgi:hypothetical protein
VDKHELFRIKERQTNDRIMLCLYLFIAFALGWTLGNSYGEKKPKLTATEIEHRNAVSETRQDQLQQRP